MLGRLATMPSLARLPEGEHPPIIDISNFEERKDEIVAQLMDAAQRLGTYVLRPVLSAVSSAFSATL